ncbi:acyl-homoserine-lactone synthase [Bradyrhizobium prioriisuperbiae]|uniref:acyl-homoserine-lactone synthase n=1 Tax=Bradyrhizobium prioriisuperbiae TaxID=2854389 RepID=UPI0028EED298|nr:acyl-homoserine-lactone synthase [Bradyrhizobium prioritasuperba]
MRAIVLKREDFGSQLHLLEAMYRLRRQVFRDRLDWNVAISDGFELDIFDILNPCYLLVLSDDGDVVGSVRLLPTTGPTMLAETFAALLDGGPVPHSATVLESSRFCVDTTIAGKVGGQGLNRATFLLFAAMIEHLHTVDAMSIVTVTDLRMERILRRAGWPLERIAAPQPIGKTMALAGYLHRSEAALTTICQYARLERPVLSLPPVMRAAR